MMVLPKICRGTHCGKVQMNGIAKNNSDGIVTACNDLDKKIFSMNMLGMSLKEWFDTQENSEKDKNTLLTVDDLIASRALLW